MAGETDIAGAPNYYRGLLADGPQCPPANFAKWLSRRC